MAHSSTCPQSFKVFYVNNFHVQSKPLFWNPDLYSHLIFSMDWLKVNQNMSLPAGDQTKLLESSLRSLLHSSGILLTLPSKIYSEFYHFSLLPLKKKLFFNWQIIAFQNFAIFCQTSTCISHRDTHVPSLLGLPPVSPPSQPSRLIQGPCLSALNQSKFPLLPVLHLVLELSMLLSHLTLSSPPPPPLRLG